jgi:hypothetical protein
MKRASVTTHEARRVEHGVMEWAKYQLRPVSHLPYREACDASGLRAEDSAVGQAYRELRNECRPNR